MLGSLFFRCDRPCEMDLVVDIAEHLELVKAKETELPEAGDAVNLDFARNIVRKSRIARSAILPNAGAFESLTISDL